MRASDSGLKDRYYTMSQPRISRAAQDAVERKTKSEEVNLTQEQIEVLEAERSQLANALAARSEAFNKDTTATATAAPATGDLAARLNKYTIVNNAETKAAAEAKDDRGRQIFAPLLARAAEAKGAIVKMREESLIRATEFSMLDLNTLVGYSPDGGRTAIPGRVPKRVKDGEQTNHTDIVALQRAATDAVNAMSGDFQVLEDALARAELALDANPEGQVFRSTYAWLARQVANIENNVNAARLSLAAMAKFEALVRADLEAIGDEVVDAPVPDVEMVPVEVADRSREPRSSSSFFDFDPREALPKTPKPSGRSSPAASSGRRG